MSEVLASLRSLMASHSPPLDALVVPSEDYHQSEYVSARDKRREFVSGFTGSAGLALITKNEALLWTDGRYFLQATEQLSDEWRLMRMGEDPVVEAWMADHLPCEASVGVDPWCVSVDTAKKWEQAFCKRKQKLIPTSTDLVDQVWNDRPPAEINPLVRHPIEFTGLSVVEKLKELRVKIQSKKARALIITALDEVAWLYNIRGTDVAYCPVVHAFAIVTFDSTFLYVDKKKLSDEANAYLQALKIEVREYSDVISDVGLLAANQLGSSFGKDPGFYNEFENGEPNKVERIWVDPASCCFALYSKLDPDLVLLQPSPISLAKSLKNPVELEGLKKAHIRDGAAVVQFLAWLDKQMQDLYGASGYFLEGEAKKNIPLGTEKLTEVSVSDKLESFRASKEHFRGLSFPTISSVGQNAAIIHYSPEPETCAELDPNKIYLCDSGAQYLDGTTDITRTVHFGKPSAHEKDCYTAVLKGHVGLGNARFPKGTNGYTLDILARVNLWDCGLDYRHGTGHGVGSYLFVHEGPQQISFRPSARNVPLQASMTVTDEPGYYEDGNFGVRLENVLVVKDAETKFNFGDKGYLEFEHITWAPYQVKLINLNKLTGEEIGWLNAYHSKCREVLAPLMNQTEMEWLMKATEPVSA
ncbi:PREDICTED: probable Xaa-Pro aminopeptidase P [Tarenaya hassleriana]|uniref:probable Xaa-Pro aminopeptidase P n=1 Tax=Tarenaya hassleriana TaxID=28532 RepID=UPI00053C914D|nr:PREDICTED: probable Xaa-Pro aminopeptidase P [Tarenaya hassleriana]